MKGIKIELLGIAIIPLGIAVTTNNFYYEEDIDSIVKEIEKLLNCG